jgi:uncharacterized protein YuzB (UPF0349 family)
MFPLVEFCITNLANGAQETYDILEQDPNVEVLEYGCLSFCSECAQGFYAIVDGELVQADTPTELTQKIYAHIENNPMW